MSTFFCFVSGLTAIGQNCHNLQKLDVSFCNKISNEGVNFVSTKCGKLHFLGLFSCENVETDFLLELEKNYPHILFYCFNLEYNRLIKRASEQGYLWLQKTLKGIQRDQLWQGRTTTTAFFAIHLSLSLSLSICLFLSLSFYLSLSFSLSHLKNQTPKFLNLW